MSAPESKSARDVIELKADDVTLPDVSFTPASSQVWPKDSAALMKLDFNIFHSDKTVQHTDILAGQEPANANAEYDRGFENGKKNAEDVYNATLGVMEETLSKLQNQFAQSQKDYEASYLNAVENALEALLPTLIEIGFVAELKSLLAQLCEVPLEGGVTVSCSEIHKNQLESLVNKAAVPDQFKMNIDSKLEGCVEISWQSGGAEIEFDKAVKSALASLTARSRANI